MTEKAQPTILPKTIRCILNSKFNLPYATHVSGRCDDFLLIFWVKITLKIFENLKRAS